MGIFEVTFAASGVTADPLVLMLITACISFVTSMGGVSGAFLVMPLQVSMLHFAGPAASATNFVYNLVGIPGGVWGYVREKRLFWPLVGTIVIGTLPGLVAGYYIRILYLPEPADFKRFIGAVLLLVGGKLLAEAIMRKGASPPAPEQMLIENIRTEGARVRFEFQGSEYGFNRPGLMALSLIVGVIGGVYGIGGGAIIAPFCVAVFGLPVYVVAGAALFGTFVGSLGGVAFYSLLPSQGAAPASPDWLLGAVLGAGGFVGMYLGARAQKHLPQRLIKLALGVMITGLGLAYVSGAI